MDTDVGEETLRTYARAGFGATTPRGVRPALVIVDFSRGFTDPNYPTGSELSSQVGATRQLLDVARAAALPVFYTTIAFDPDDQTDRAWLRKAPGLAILAAGTDLVEIDDRIAPLPTEAVIVKKGASAFFGTDLAEQLRVAGADTVVMCGATTSGCIRASAVDSVQNDFATLVVRDAVGDRAQSPHDANLFDIGAKYGDVISIDDALAYYAAVAQEITS